MNGMSMNGPSSNVPPALQPVAAQYTKWMRQYRHLLDMSAPHVMHRWIGTSVVASLFMLRIVLAQGWYIVCYALGIYLLNLLLAFLQPKFDPSLEEDLTADEIEEGGTSSESGFLPSQNDDEFRPFVRRLPEWNFWLSATRATAVALVLSFFEAFDIPVYWPILLMYFVILFCLTMRKQIQHMIKYKYIPFDFGRKTRYGPR